MTSIRPREQIACSCAISSCDTHRRAGEVSGELGTAVTVLSWSLLSQCPATDERANTWRRFSAEQVWKQSGPIRTAREAKRMIEESWVWAHLSHGLRRPARRRPPRRRQQRILIMMPSSSQPLGTRRAGSVAAGRRGGLLPGGCGGGLRSLPATIRVSSQTTAREPGLTASSCSQGSGIPCAVGLTCRRCCCSCSICCRREGTGGGSRKGRNTAPKSRAMGEGIEKARRPNSRYTVPCPQRAGLLRHPERLTSPKSRQPALSTTQTIGERRRTAASPQPAAQREAAEATASCSPTT
eukprot:COSAG04_NODE_274_length_18488_cov_35.031377_9_plen_296_part_00